MKELFLLTWGLISNTLLSLWAVLESVGTWLFGVLLVLHNDMPRIEGLLIGILFAWALRHRDRNPIVKALAAPIKILVDILDIVWDETIEALQDLYAMLKEKATGITGSALGKVKDVWNRGLEFLLGLKSKIKAKADSNDKKE